MSPDAEAKSATVAVTLRLTSFLIRRIAPVDHRIAGIAGSSLDLPTAGHSSFRAVGPMYDLAKYSSRDGGTTVYGEAMN